MIRSSASSDLQDEGGVIVEGLLDDDTLARQCRARSVARADAAGTQFVGLVFLGTRRLITAVASSRERSSPTLLHPTLLGLSDAILAPACALSGISRTCSIAAPVRAANIHRDEVVWIRSATASSCVGVGDCAGRFTENGATRGARQSSLGLEPDAASRGIRRRGDAGGIRRDLPGLHAARRRSEHDDR
jgi:hypothetical protein